MDELLQEFIAETRETLAALASEIVAWEADPADRARLDAIFRFVHTVKGSCGFLDLPRLARLSHEAENVLAQVRDGRRAPDAHLVDGVLGIVDRIGELTIALETGAPVDERGDEQLIAALAEVEEGAAAPEIATATAAAPGGQQPAERRALRSVRLPVDLLDRVMNGMSEMVLARNELARQLRENGRDPATDSALERLSLTVADLRETISRTRMQAIEALFAALPRMVRDTSSHVGKQVTLTIEGGEVEIDREMIEAMRDPLMHIVRNAIDHGIESAEARVAAGKPAVGRMTVSARQSGNTIVIEVTDDGAGIDTARLVAKHAAANGRDPAEYARLSDRARLELVFEPGLSSRDDVSEISGRGVGMDVVRANVEQIGGRIELRNDPGRGLTIRVHVPLTLSILPTIILEAGDQRFAIARQSVEEIVAADCGSVRIHALGDGAIATVRGQRMAVVELGQALGIRTESLGIGSAEAPAMLAIVGVPGGAFALAVDRVIDMQELVVKPAAPQVMACGLYAGQTLPDTGVPMLVLDAGGIATANGISFTRNVLAETEVEVEEDPGLEALLILDLDGRTRAVPLAAVDRIEVIPASRLSVSGGRLRLADEAGLIDVSARATPPADGEVTVIRMRCRGRDTAMVVEDAMEIVALGNDWADADHVDGLLGVALYEGAPVEVIDPSASHDGRHAQDVTQTGEKPLCVLAGEAQRWMAGFLAPALERAGYRVAIGAATGEPALAVLAMAGEEVPLPDGGGALIRLDERPGEGGVYRYDRAAVLAALARTAR